MPDQSSPPPGVPVEEAPKKARRFAPEPLETTTRSSKKVHKDNAPDLSQDTTERRDFAGKRRFSPTPIETTFKSSKRPGQIDLPTPEPTPNSIPRSSPPEETPKPRRKFTPELIETTKRSKRSNTAGPATLPTDKVSSWMISTLLVPANHRCNGRPTLLPESQIYTLYARRERPMGWHTTSLLAAHKIK